MGKATLGFRAAALASVAAIVLAACGGGSGGSNGNGDSGSASGDKPVKGGTLTFLELQEQIQHMDPQRNYTGEDLAFVSGYMQRTLNVYKFSTDGEEANTLVPDLATDTGKATDGAKTWTWTLKDGVKFEDGSPVTCADIKYGVSRTFATDLITDGPQYAVQYLDVPKAKDGSSVYKGPYDTKASNDTAAFDKSIDCSADNKTITFHLAQPVGDFNQSVTLLSFSPVPKAADTAEKYDDKPVSSGPYKISEYTKGSQLVLVRNDNWDAKTDTYRPAYPDKIVVKYGLEASVIDQRMIADSGEDQKALTPNSIEPASLSTVFGQDRFKDRRVNDLDPYVRYFALRADKLDLNQRKAIAAALDRAQLRTIAGGDFAGDLADGVVKPNLPIDYAESGMFDGGLLGQNIPPEGDPAFAKKLLAEDGKPLGTLQFDYAQTPTLDRMASAVKASLGKAGIKVKPNPIEAGQFYGIVFDPEKAGEIINSGWGPDWANASTVVPPLFTPAGGFDLSQVDDKAFNAKVADALAEVDRDKQAQMWKDLNKEAMSQVWVVPYRFGRAQRLAGSKIHAASGDNGKVYIWGPYGSWSYGDLWVEQ
jgi:peptide/nickel transport system substrate-binding protein